MDWDAYIPFYRSWLLRLLAGLWQRLGDVPGMGPGGAAPADVPRHLRSALSRMLRPMESALRRLLVCKATLMQMPALRLGRRRAGKARLRRRKGPATAPAPAFRLIDPRKDFRPRRRRPRAVPRITFLDEWTPPPKTPEPMPDDPVPAGALVRRLQAMQGALDDLDAAAQRMARYRARQAAYLALPLDERGDYRKRVPLDPMRPGRAPGWRQERREEVHELLLQTNRCARRALDDAEPQEPPPRAA